MQRAISYQYLLPILCCAIAVGIVLSVTNGPMAIPAGQSLLAIWDVLWGTQHNALLNHQAVVVVELRWPRTLMALFIGALISVCGAVTQGLFRNPLADPGIIGISTGAGLGAAIAIVIVPVGFAVYATPLFAFFGGLAATLLVYKLAQGPNGTSVLILLLSGIAIAAFAGAAIGFLTFIANDQALRDLTLWGMGTLNGATMSSVSLVAVTTFCLIALYWREANGLNALLIGEPEARHLGINVEALKLRLILLTAFGIGIAVAMTGVIGFIGLVVPHLVRMLVGPDHRVLLPLSALTGAVLLLFADIASRLLVSPAELPVGLMTSLVGAPFFTFLLIQQRKKLL